MTTTARPGRKREAARDDVILDATVAVLSRQGYDGTTIDLVAAEAGMARATVYRRWPTKADLVLAAVSRLSRHDVDVDQLPDTGAFRSDVLALSRSFDAQEQHTRLQVMVGLLALADADPRLAQAALDAGIGPWIAAHRALMQRAVDRGELPSHDASTLDTLAEVVPMLYVARAVQRLPITGELGEHLLDHVLIPALRGSDPTHREERP